MKNNTFTKIKRPYNDFVKRLMHINTYSCVKKIQPIWKSVHTCVRGTNIQIRFISYLIQMIIQAVWYYV